MNGPLATHYDEGDDYGDDYGDEYKEEYKEYYNDNHDYPDGPGEDQGNHDYPDDGHGEIQGNHDYPDSPGEDQGNHDYPADEHGSGDYPDFDPDRIMVDPTEHPGREWIGHDNDQDQIFSTTAEIIFDTTEPLALEPGSPGTTLNSGDLLLQVVPYFARPTTSRYM